MGKSSGKETWEYAFIRRKAKGERRKAKGKRIRIKRPARLA